jgi:hypothetical protein
VQAAWQVWLPGQQLGVVPLPQSVFVLHWTQLPCTQKRIDAGHCESVVHTTHPRVGSHCSPEEHIPPPDPHKALAAPPPSPVAASGETLAVPMLPSTPELGAPAASVVIPAAPPLLLPEPLLLPLTAPPLLLPAPLTLTPTPPSSTAAYP